MHPLPWLPRGLLAEHQGRRIAKSKRLVLGPHSFGSWHLLCITFYYVPSWRTCLLGVFRDLRYLHFHLTFLAAGLLLGQWVFAKCGHWPGTALGSVHFISYALPARWSLPVPAFAEWKQKALQPCMAFPWPPSSSTALHPQPILPPDWAGPEQNSKASLPPRLSCSSSYVCAGHRSLKINNHSI